jgi:hypothetical protein
VLGRIPPLLAVGWAGFIRALRCQSAREIVDDQGDVVVERAAREPRGGRELGIATNRLAPQLQETLAVLSKVVR